MPEQPVPEVAGEPPSRRATTTRARLETVAIAVAFTGYAVFASKLLLFSRPPGSERSVNLVPFASIWHYLVGGSAGARRFALANLAGNVLLFVPLGAYLSMRARATVPRTMLVVALTSVAVEIVQGVFALGASDVDDVILNCLGGLVGIVLFRLLMVSLRDRERVRTVVAVVSVLALPVLALLLFVIRLHL